MQRTFCAQYRFCATGGEANGCSTTAVTLYKHTALGRTVAPPNGSIPVLSMQTPDSVQAPWRRLAESRKIRLTAARPSGNRRSTWRFPGKDSWPTWPASKTHCLPRRHSRTHWQRSVLLRVMHGRWCPSQYRSTCRLQPCRRG